MRPCEAAVRPLRSRAAGSPESAKRSHETGVKGDQPENAKVIADCSHLK